MSFDRSGGRPARRRPPTPLQAAVEARGQLQEQFYRVDQLQRDIGTTVRSYAALLPDRARSTGVVPGFETLDHQAHALILEYLELLDRFDPLEDAVLTTIQQSIPAFNQLTPKLGHLADEFNSYLDRFGSELQRLGDAKEAVRRRVAEATAAVLSAEAAWRTMRDGGYEFVAVDEALARARVAARKLSGMEAQLTPDKVDEPAKVVERMAAEARQLATELPQRAATLSTRIPSLSTRIDALETRASTVPASMGALRREYSLGNWADIADQERDVERVLAGARTRLREMRILHDAGDYPAALDQLSAIEAELKAAGALVDGPRERLEVLRSIKQNPQALFDRARFTLRDARYLILKGRQVAPQPWGGRLDSAASELIALEDLLEGVHPNYWELHTRMERLQGRVKQLVDDFRNAH